ncbi:MAG TPA: SgcJ/EcaC family oxidoreductase, partial [Pseudonocardia sp.]
FTDDARYVTASGTRAVGRQDIAATHQKIFDSAFRGTTLGVSYPVELQPVTPTVVLVHGSGTVIFPGSSEQTLRPTALLTMVAVNDGDAWRLAAFSNTPVGAVDRVA